MTALDNTLPQTYGAPMEAKIIPRMIECICGAFMQIQVTSKTATCLNPACSQNGKDYELPVQAVTLSEKTQ